MKLNFGLSTVALGTILAATSSASMITGVVDISGTAGVSATAIDFYQNPPQCATGPNPGTTGCFGIGTATGSFAGNTNLNGNIKDLVNPGAPVTAFMTFPVGGVIFDLVNTPLAGQPPCSAVNTTQGGVTCVPGGNSPFRLTNGPGPGPNGTGTAQSVSIQFSVNVNGYIGTTATGSTPYIGVFTTQLAGQTIQDVLTALAANGGTGIIVHSYSASFAPGPTTMTPEPGSMALMGFGLLGLAAATRRFARR